MFLWNISYLKSLKRNEDYYLSMRLMNEIINGIE